ncbi:MAG: hypothetical protein ACRBCS_15810 [Cellvibrionaceae bacterium]
MTSKLMAARKTMPSGVRTKSLQFELFQTFVTNDDAEVSNAIELWEGIPKYFFTPQKMESLRTPKGHADPYKWDFNYNNLPCTVKIQPALLEQEDGSYKAFFPGVTEELVEEALKKVFISKGLHFPNESESWVRFSLNMIKRELRDCGRSRDISKIKTAIEIMSKCIITLYKENKEVWTGSILQDLTTVGREDYLVNTTDSYHIARLPLFVSQGLNNLQYRQYNHRHYLSCDEQLSRWLYKLMINRYKQANPENTYHFKFSTVSRDSGLLQQANDRRNRTKLNSALEELKEKDVLREFTERYHKEGRMIVDVVYTVWPSDTFISEQKSAFKRSKDAQMTALQNGLPVNKAIR